MRIPRKVGRFRAVIAAVVLAIGALAIPSSTVPASTQSAIATQPAAVEDMCSAAVNPLNWVEVTGGPGVTMCLGEDSSPPTGDAYVQIVDLTAGAKVRLISQSCRELCPYTDTRRFTDLKYRKRTATEWFDWLQDPANFRTPGPNRLFSTSNASFFIDLSPLTDTTKLSLPERSLVEIWPGPAAVVEASFGWAFDTCTDDNPHDPPIPDHCHNDPAWDKPKIAVSFGDNTLPTQKVEMLAFPTHFTAQQGSDLLGGGKDWDPDRLFGDQMVGFTPTDTAGAAPRTYLGVDNNIADKVYILNTSAHFTGAEAQQILESFGAAFTMQLDGGGSTQLATDANDDGNADYLIDSDDPEGADLPGFDRAVPDTLAVYTAS